MKRGLASRARSPVSGPSVEHARARAPRDTRYIWSYIFGAVCPEPEAAALIMPHADTQAIGAHLAEIAKSSHRAHMPFSFWMALAGTVRQSWRSPTTSPCSNSRPIPLNSTRWKMCELICVPTSSPYPSSTIMSRSSKSRCEAVLLCKRQPTASSRQITTRQWANSCQH